MKHFIRLALFIALAAAGLFSSCEKDDWFKDGASSLKFPPNGGSIKVKLTIPKNGLSITTHCTTNSYYNSESLPQNYISVTFVSDKEIIVSMPANNTGYTLNGTVSLTRIGQTQSIEVRQDSRSNRTSYGTGLFVSVTGFNNDLNSLSFKDITRSYNDIRSKIDGLNMADGTVLYYAMEDAINRLQGEMFADDFNSAYIITFTDGLDQGSSAMNPIYNSASEYLATISNRLKSPTVQGKRIQAYTIGLKGNDVMDEALFLKNLKGLASSEANAMEVSNINEINTKFQELASSLYQESTTQSIKLTIPQPYNNTKIRFTFDVGDNGDATKSKYYIEGTYNAGKLNNISYKGMTCDSGKTIETESAGGINISIKFDNLQFNNGFEPAISNIKHWEFIQSSGLWQINSEFNPNKSIDNTVEKQSAAIVLLLDCSSSLGSDFSAVKSAANNFIKTLYDAYNAK